VSVLAARKMKDIGGNKYVICYGKRAHRIWNMKVWDWGRRGVHTGCWWEIQKERDHWEDQDVGGWTILKQILER
jgi:hypothetical protein